MAARRIQWRLMTASPVSIPLLRALCKKTPCTLPSLLRSEFASDAIAWHPTPPMPNPEFDFESDHDQTERPPDKSNDDDDAEQQRLLQEYLMQQRRRACPGCGEEPFLG